METLHEATANATVVPKSNNTFNLRTLLVTLAREKTTGVFAEGFYDNLPSTCRFNGQCDPIRQATQAKTVMKEQTKEKNVRLWFDALSGATTYLKLCDLHMAQGIRFLMEFTSNNIMKNIVNNIDPDRNMKLYDLKEKLIKTLGKELNIASYMGYMRNMKQDPSESVHEFGSRVSEVAYRSLNQERGYDLDPLDPTDERDIYFRMALAIPNGYKKSLKSCVSKTNYPTDPLDWIETLTRVENAEQTEENMEYETLDNSFFTSRETVQGKSDNKTSDNKKNKGNSKDKCQWCDKYGHLANVCRALIAKNGGEKIPIKATNKNYSVANTKPGQKVCQLCSFWGHLAPGCNNVADALGKTTSSTEETVVNIPEKKQNTNQNVNKQENTTVNKPTVETRAINSEKAVCARCGAKDGHTADICYTRGCTKCGNHRHFEPYCIFKGQGKACFRCENNEHSYKDCPDKPPRYESNKDQKNKNSNDSNNKSKKTNKRQDKNKDRSNESSIGIVKRIGSVPNADNHNSDDSDWGIVGSNLDHRPQLCKRDKTTNKIECVPLLRAFLREVQELKYKQYFFYIMFDTGATQSTICEDTAFELEKRGRILETHSTTHSLYSASCTKIKCDKSVKINLEYREKLSFNNCPLYVTKTPDKGLITIGSDMMKHWGSVAFDYRKEGTCVITIPLFDTILEAKTREKYIEELEGKPGCEDDLADLLKHDNWPCAYLPEIENNDESTGSSAYDSDTETAEAISEVKKGNISEAECDSDPETAAAISIAMEQSLNSDNNVVSPAKQRIRNSSMEDFIPHDELYSTVVKQTGTKRKTSEIQTRYQQVKPTSIGQPIECINENNASYPTLKLTTSCVENVKSHRDKDITELFSAIDKINALVQKHVINQKEQLEVLLDTVKQSKATGEENKLNIDRIIEHESSINDEQLSRWYNNEKAKEALTLKNQKLTKEENKSTERLMNFGAQESRNKSRLANLELSKPEEVEDSDISDDSTTVLESQENHFLE